jgi:hypothetical protein
LNREARSTVRNIIVAVLLSLSAFAWAEGNPKPADYTINVHVSKSFFGTRGEQKVNVIVDGKKYELVSTGDRWLLALGDYKAKLVKDEHRGTYNSHRVYEFLFPDQKTRHFWVVGETE